MSSTGTSVSRRNRRVAIAVGLVIGAILGLNLLAQGMDRAVGGNEPKGVGGSFYATTPDGVAAYATLLSHFGYDIGVQRGPVAEHPPPRFATFVVLEPAVLTDDDTAALLQFATDGGRLIVGGRAPFYLRHLRDEPPQWNPDGRSLWTTIDSSLAGVNRVDAAGQGSWTTPGSGRVVIGTTDRSLLTIDRVGRGEILFLADPTPIENAFLARADNAAFGVDLAGERPVVFAEGVHGYGTNTGLSAIPGRWKIALVVLTVAAIALIWSRARRFGPADHRARELPPARAEYVRALALTLHRTRQPGTAFVPLQQYARDRVAARAALGAEPTDEQIAGAARGFGCSDAEIEALLGSSHDDAHVLALGHAVARVSGDNRRIE